METVQNNVERKQKAQSLGQLIKNGKLTKLAEKIAKPTGLTVAGARTAIVRTVKGTNSADNAAKILAAVEKHYEKLGKDLLEKETKKNKPSDVQGTKDSTDEQALLKQVKFIKHAMLHSGITAWNLSSKLYKEIGSVSSSSGANRIYNALKLVGSPSTIKPVLDCLCRYFTNTMLAEKKLTPTTITAPIKKERTEKSQTPVEQQKKTTDWENKLREIKIAVESGKLTITDLLATLPKTFAQDAGIPLLLLPSAIDVMVRNPEAIRFSMNGSHHWLCTAINAMWALTTTQQTLGTVVQQYATRIQTTLNELLTMVSGSLPPK